MANEPGFNPIRDPLGALYRFIGAALFGVLLSVILLGLITWWFPRGFWYRPLANLLWALPLVWGVLGIFWFDRMLDLARDIFEFWFNIGDHRR